MVAPHFCDGVPQSLLQPQQKLTASHNASLDAVVPTFACSFCSAYGPFCPLCECEGGVRRLM